MPDFENRFFSPHTSIQQKQTVFLVNFSESGWLHDEFRSVVQKSVIRDEKTRLINSHNRMAINSRLPSSRWSLFWIREWQLPCLARGAASLLSAQQRPQRGATVLAVWRQSTAIVSLAARLSCKEKEVPLPRYQPFYLYTEGVSSTKAT